jgi:opacity protein-like surface antigen
MTFRAVSLLSVSALLLSSSAALATDLSWQNWDDGNWYVSGMAGATFLNDQDSSGSGLNFTTHPDTGYNISGALGRYVTNNIRVEGEIGYRRAEMGLVTNGPTLQGGGNSHATSFMANAYYEFPLGRGWKPYVGGGIGFADVSLDHVTQSGSKLVDDSDVVFAYQGGGGIGYEIDPRNTIFVDYRYFGTADPSFRANNGTQVTSEFGSQNLSLGWRYKF